MEPSTLAAALDEVGELAVRIQRSGRLTAAKQRELMTEYRRMRSLVVASGAPAAIERLNAIDQAMGPVRLPRRRVPAMPPHA